MSEKSLSKNTRKNVILLHIAVMCFSFSGVIGQYVQVPAVQVAMGRVICSSLLLLAISLVCKDKLTLDSKKDYGLMIMTGNGNSLVKLLSIHPDIVCSNWNDYILYIPAVSDVFRAVIIS